MLVIEKVNQLYGGSQVLWDVGFDVPESSCTCLMGRNGVGKTTLLKVIMGLLPARDGHVRLMGEPLLGRPAEIRARLGMAYVPQGRDIFANLTVEENLRIGLTTVGRKLGGRRAIPDLVFDLFPVLAQMLKRRGGNLSGGQQQQLAIGRALVLQPKILMLDEPTEGIQPNVVDQIGDIIEKLNKEAKISVLLVEQKLAFARRVASRYVILDRGRSVASGPMVELNDALVKKHLTV